MILYGKKKLIKWAQQMEIPRMVVIAEIMRDAKKNGDEAVYAKMRAQYSEVVARIHKLNNKNRKTRQKADRKS